MIRSLLCIASLLTQSPKLVRIAVVDDSGSMAGDRIAVVRRELNDMLAQLPPTPDYPFVLVSFGSQAAAPRVFTDLAPATTAINALAGGSGGTNIAAGLACACDELGKYASVPQVCVLLYSDGEDSNTNGILAQESRLDALFSQRDKQGLGNTVVFCKRWGNANALLREAIEKRGHARVLDAGEAVLIPVTIEPRLELKGTAWSEKEPSTLEVTLMPQLRVDGDLDSAKTLRLRLHCVTPGVTGDIDAELSPEQTASPLSLVVPVPDAAFMASKLDLAFEISPPEAQFADGGMLFPLLTTETIAMSVPLPDRRLRNIITAGIEYRQPARWIDPLALTAAYPIVLSFDVRAGDDYRGDRSTTVRIIPEADTRIIEGNDVFRLPGPGRYEVPLTLQLSSSSAAGSAGLQFGFGFVLRPENVPPNVTFEPPELPIRQTGLAPPSLVITTIVGDPATVRSISWCDLRRGLAVIEATTKIHVKGPIPPGTAITLLARSGVTRLRCEPKSLHTGTQPVLLKLVAPIQPTPRKNKLEFAIVPPPQVGAVQFQSHDPISLSFVGPSPVRLVAANRGTILQQVNGRCPDNARTVSISFEPRIVGSATPDAAASLQARALSPDSSFGIASGTLGPVNTPRALVLSVPSDRHISFFRDTLIKGWVQLTPDPDSPAVIGSRYPTELTIQAPFKRLAFRLALAVSSLLAFFVLARMYTRLRHSE
jgi:hypothetical protein